MEQNKEENVRIRDSPSNAKDKFDSLCFMQPLYSLSIGRYVVQVLDNISIARELLRSPLLCMYVILQRASLFNVIPFCIVLAGLCIEHVTFYLRFRMYVNFETREN